MAEFRCKTIIITLRGYCLLLFLSGSVLSHAQIPVQLFGGHRAIEFDFMWQKDMDKNGKFNLFNFSYFSLDYQNSSDNAYEIYLAGTYNLNRTWGIAGGGRFLNGELWPQIAISYQLETSNLYFNILPAVQYIPSLRTTGYGLFGLFSYTPGINEVWGLFTQIVFEPFFGNEGHIYSVQMMRLGLDYKSLFQFGFGANLEQIGKEFQLTHNYGLFIRRVLN